VKATNGDTHLGGDDWDELLVNHLADAFKQENAIDLRQDRQALQRLREASEKAKCELSSMLETTISLPFITADQSGPKHLNVTLTRSQFQDLTRPLLDRCTKPFEDALKDAGVKKEALNEVVLVGGSTRMPAVQELVKQLTGREANKTVDPDEVVAAGAAIQASILTGQGGGKDIVLVDVTPLSLGVETQGGVMDILIPRNTAIPSEQSRVYTTARDLQTDVDVKVLQGERPLARDNRSLGVVNLGGIPPAQKGIPEVEVTFSVDANGILHVTARERKTGVEQKVTIAGSTTLSKQDVDRIMKDAEAHADEDQRRQELIEARHNASTLASQVDRLLQEQGDRVPEAEKGRVEAALRTVRSLEASEDLEAVKSAFQELEESYRAVGDAMFRAAGEQSSAAEPSDDSTADEAPES